MKNLIDQMLFVIIWCLAMLTPTLAQSTDVYSCVTDLVNVENPRKEGSRAVHQPSKKWVPGQQIRVKFLDGSEYLRNQVKQNAEFWEEFANIDFVFVESGAAEIRVSFTMDKGSWSFMGKDSAIQSYIKKGTDREFVKNNSGASMNFGWFNQNTPDEEFRRTTLHEFGHALGLKHEHQNANRNIEWNEDAVFAYFAKQGWSREKVQSQVLARYGFDKDVSNGVYDPLSIMHYYYPPELVKGSLNKKANTTLSDNDKAIIEEMYPFDDNIATVTKPPVNTPTIKPVSPPVVPSNVPIFSFTDVAVDFEGFDEKTDQDGMSFLSDFKVKNGLKQEFTMAIYFYEADNTPLKDSNKKFYSTSGQVAVFRKFVPAYADSVFNQFEIFMPYEELELDCGEHSLKYSIGIWNGQKRIISTGYTYFTLEIPCEE